MVVEVSIASTTPPTGPEKPPEPQATPKAESQERPEWLPEKFKSAEELAKAYGELESKLGAPKAEEPKPAEEPAPQVTEDRFASFEAEFAEKGELSEESFKALEEMGIPKRLVDAYLTGVQASAAREVEKIYSVAGGEQKYQELVQWAATSLPGDEITALNELIEQGGDKALFAVKSIKRSYELSNGAGPSRLIQGDGPGDVDSYQDYQQLLLDMGSKKYQEDPGFRDRVAKKLARSKGVI